MTTLQYVMETLRNGDLVESGKVNYGITDKLKPPYIDVLGFNSQPVRDTCGIAMKHSEFHVVCFQADADTAQELGQGIIALLDQSTSVTPSTSRCYWTDYRIGQTEMGLYIFAVDITFRLEESGNSI